MRKGRRNALAEELDAPVTHAAPVTRQATRSRSVRPQRAARPAGRRPGRSLATILVVAGLVTAVAIPAYAAYQPQVPTRTIQQAAEDGAQKLIVASEVESAGLDRASYAASTPQEIAKKKAKAAALSRAKAARTAWASIDLSMTGPGTGPIRWPLRTITHIGDGFHTRGGEHQGTDFIAPAKTPIFASTSGVVRVSQDGYYGYGVAVVIDGVIDGRKVSTLYAHMTYGSRTVKAGQHVEAGQLIGLVGNTGRSAGNHLHFEVGINGTRVDPLAWLRAND